MPDRLNLALILGSNRQPRLCDTVAAWATARVRAHGAFAMETLDPLALGLPAALPITADLATRRLQRQVGAADAFLVVTPEYNHGYPAPLKQLIDAAGEGWQAKPVAFIGYGGLSGGLRAVEQLKLVFASLHAVPVHDCVVLSRAWELFDAAGAMLEPADAERAAHAMLSRLCWWGRALRAARAQSPYRTGAAA